MESIIFNTFFAFLSAGLGMIFGVWWTEKERDDNRQKEKRILRQKLTESFQFNLGEMKKMHRMITEDSKIPDFHLDSESVGHILFHGQDLFDEHWFTKFNWQRYQFIHINAKVDFLNMASHISPDTSSAITLPQRGQTLLASLQVVSRDVEALLSSYTQSS